MSLISYYNQLIGNIGLPLIPIKYHNSRELAYEKIFNKVANFTNQLQSQPLSFISPCLQKQRIDDIRSGRRLSLEFLMITSFRAEEDNQIEYVIEKCTGLSYPVKICFQGEDDDNILKENDLIKCHLIEEATGFPYSGKAMDLYNCQGIWLGRVLRFIDHDNHTKFILSLCLEQLLLNAEKATNIWLVSSFFQRRLNGREIYFMDQTRKNAFLYNEDTLGLSSSWLPKDLFYEEQL